MSEWWAGDVPPSMTEELEMTCECPDEDDLDRLEELEPEPGRVGRANHLRRFAKSWRLRTDFLVSDGGSET